MSIYVIGIINSASIIFIVRRRRDGSDDLELIDTHLQMTVPEVQMLQDITIKKILGSGNYGDVYLGKWRGFKLT